MSLTKLFRPVAVTLAVTGMLLPVEETRSQEAASCPTTPTVHDIRLDDQGSLHGVVVNAQGQTQPKTRITLVDLQRGKRRANATSRDGKFVFQRLAGGTYHLKTAHGVCHCRVWTAAAAPPTAKAQILIVDDALVQRGQRPVRELFTSDPLLMAVVVAAAVAIPIAVHQSRDDDAPGS
jgi:hypothetical protein